ncbi:MAG TPA: hypothetical protein VGJ20_02595 [Xanthobacteraceae bacterium]|jgi:hypothetical protein
MRGGRRAAAERLRDRWSDGNEVLAGDQASTKSRVVIYRTSPAGLAVQPPYYIDGKSIALSTPLGFVVCHVGPGTHQVAVGNFPINVNFGGGTDKASVTLRPGQTTYLKAEPQLGLTVGVITLSEVTESQGKADTASLHKLDGSCT